MNHVTLLSFLTATARFKYIMNHITIKNSAGIPTISCEIESDHEQAFEKCVEVEHMITRRRRYKGYAITKYTLHI